jgi:hypothetical protein
MLKRHRTRWVISGTLLVLVVVIMGLTFDATRVAYTRYTNARQLVRANRLADDVLSAAAASATERGITASQLGRVSRRGSSANHRPVSTRVTGLRASVDERWRTVQASAPTVSMQPAFTAALDEARDRYKEVLKAREQIDASVQSGEATITGAEWVTTMGAFIGAMEHLGRAAFVNQEVLGELGAFNLTVRQWVWEASEYAGWERGTLAYYIGAVRPLLYEG